MEQLNLEAEELAKIKIAPADFEIFSERLFPVTEEMGVRKEESQMMLRQGLKQMWLEDDLNNVRDTAWGVLNAVADMVSHRQPARASENWRANNFMSIIDGTTIMNDAQNIIRAW
jgi:DnaJ-domain-containing protein 1